VIANSDGLDVRKAGSNPAFCSIRRRPQPLAIFPDIAHIVIPPQAIIVGMPIFIMAIMRSQHSMNISFMESSIGTISHFMPVGVMVQVILHIIIAIGIMPFIMGIGIMPPIICIMEPIMGIGIMVGIGIAAVMARSIPL
jgi:hypothetical protein